MAMAVTVPPDTISIAGEKVGLYWSTVDAADVVTGARLPLNPSTFAILIVLGAVVTVAEVATGAMSASSAASQRCDDLCTQLDAARAEVAALRSELDHPCNAGECDITVTNHQVPTIGQHRAEQST